MTDLTQAGRILASAGVRLIDLDGRLVVGIWSDLDGPHIRNALAAFENHDSEVRYLDGWWVPDRFKLRTVPGEPVPREVLEAMQKALKNFSPTPWGVRGRMLKEMGYHRPPQPFPGEYAGCRWTRSPGPYLAEKP